MVKIMENPIKIDDLGGPPIFLETPISFSPLKDPNDFHYRLRAAGRMFDAGAPWRWGELRNGVFLS